MDKVAALPDKDRRELFEATAEKRGVHSAIIEKDFWVCWVLKNLFTSEALQGKLVFKGGTSLSKVYGLIERFSEDIDLVLNWEVLGYGPAGKDAWEKQASKSKQDKFNKAVNADAAKFLAGTLQPMLEELFAVVPEIRSVVSQDDPMVIEIGYPAAFELAAIRPEVKLEIGPLASWIPSEHREITPYAAQSFVDVFEDPACPVVAIKAERTLWEKATILHQQAHRQTAMPSNYSRHYYDLHQLAGSEVRAVALADLNLLADVVTFKQQFYPSGWARYEDAHPGSFKLMPTEVGERELAADYRAMREMLFGAVPAWSDILESLRELEHDINRLDPR